MRRRDLLKGLVTLPLASSFGASIWGNQQHKSPATQRLFVVLEGPFAIVIPGAGASDIEVYTPLDEHETHIFLLNGKRRNCRLCDITFKGKDALDSSAAPPKIDHCLDDFNYSSEAATDDPGGLDNFVEIEGLPSPSRIFCSWQFVSRVVFVSGKQGCMYSAQVLESPIKDPTKSITMTMSDTGESITPLTDICNPDVQLFNFQVGLDRKCENGRCQSNEQLDPRAAHARDFHNRKLIKERFNSLDDDDH